MQAQVNAVVVQGILQLQLSIPKEAFTAALAIKGQAAVSQLHMTLVRLDELGISVEPSELPAPPAYIDLVPQAFLADTGVKRACYLVATKEMQLKLREYALCCAEQLGLSSAAVDPDRVFHVTISNAGGGAPRASVGSPWEFPQQIA